MNFIELLKSIMFFYIIYNIINISQNLKKIANNIFVTKQLNNVQYNVVL